MKNLVPFLLILLLGCTSKESDIESIEVMSYYYIPNSDQTKEITEFTEYSKIDENGSAETIKKIKPYESKNIYFKSKINPKLISQIGESNKDKNDKYYEIKIDTNSLELYCGPIIRTKVKYKNNKILTFTYGSRKEDSRFSLFVQAQNTILKNYNQKSYKIIDSMKIWKSQKEFASFALNEDTLNFVIPRMPKNVNNQVKFPPPNK